MNDVTQRWDPVLKKIHDIEKEHWPKLAQLLENQYNEWDGGTAGDVADFTRFALPIIRKVTKNLIKQKIKFEVLTSRENTRDVSVITVTEEELQEYTMNNEIENIDAEAVLTDEISHRITDNLSKIDPLEIYILMKVAPEQISEREQKPETFQIIGLLG